ncbi:MAG: hypothetical protein M3419_00615 [Actinomycetota bacterium]|nr:hypothetical protein [Actinomycetota bacterium]
MQATVASFEHGTGAGTVLLDDGVRLAFDGHAFAASGLRHLRPGQRLHIDVADDRTTITRLAIFAS